MCVLCVVCVCVCVVVCMCVCGLATGGAETVDHLTDGYTYSEAGTMLSHDQSSPILLSAVPEVI